MTPPLRPVALSARDALAKARAALGEHATCWWDALRGEGLVYRVGLWRPDAHDEPRRIALGQGATWESALLRAIARSRAGGNVRRPAVVHVVEVESSYCLGDGERPTRFTLLVRVAPRMHVELVFADVIDTGQDIDDDELRLMWRHAGFRAHLTLQGYRAALWERGRAEVRL